MVGLVAGGGPGVTEVGGADALSACCGSRLELCAGAPHETSNSAAPRVRIIPRAVFPGCARWRETACEAKRIRSRHCAILCLSPIDFFALRTGGTGIGEAARAYRPGIRDGEPRMRQQWISNNAT